MPTARSASLSRSGNPASVLHPRVLLFGSDARLLMSFGSDPDDPHREVVDLAELQAGGLWKFRSLDFRSDPPTLSPGDAACTGCHAAPPRPFWGSYPSWPGMFGARQDLVSAAQAERLNQIRANPGGSDRFFGLGAAGALDLGLLAHGNFLRKMLLTRQALI